MVKYLSFNFNYLSYPIIDFSDSLSNDFNIICIYTPYSCLTHHQAYEDRDYSLHTRFSLRPTDLSFPPINVTNFIFVNLNTD